MVNFLLGQLRLLQYDVQAAPPLKDADSDFIALKGYAIRCVQVRTSTNSIASRKPHKDLASTWSHNCARTIWASVHGCIAKVTAGEKETGIIFDWRPRNTFIPTE